MQKGLGAIPSKVDNRDITIDKTKIAMANVIPSQYTAKYLPNVYDQGWYSQCVAFCLAKIKESQAMKERGHQIRFSPSFIYANRDISDYQGEGMVPRQALKRFSKYGVSEYRDFSILDNYNVCGDAFKSDINNLLPMGFAQKIHTYIKLNGATDIQNFLLSQDIPVMTVIDVYSNFFSPVNGVVSLPSGSYIGGHAILICGWKVINSKSYWIISNSWGTTWGDNGYCYIPFDFPIGETWGTTTEPIINEINRPQKIQFSVNYNNMIIDDTQTITMDCAPQIINGRTMIPVRFLAEALGYVITTSTDSNGVRHVYLQDGGLQQ